MADDKHYIPGSFYRICERTGYKVRADKTSMEWTGEIVRNKSWEPRQPQDFVTGVRDDQTVPNPRPRSIDQFIGPLGTVLTADIGAGDNILYLQSTIRMTAGDSVQIMMDNGVYFVTTIIDMIGPTSLQITGKMPYSASDGNVFINVTAYANPDLNYETSP